MNNFWLRLILSIICSVLILWLLQRLISSESNPLTLDALLDVLGRVSVTVFLSYLLIHLVGVFLRTLRFQVLIKATESDGVPALVPLSLVTLVRNMTVDMLPARLGELFYVGLLNRGLGVRMESCFSSLALSIWFDVMVIIPLVAGLVLYPVLGDRIQNELLTLAAVLLFICAVGILILNPGIDLFARWLRRYSDSGSRLLRGLQDFVRRFSDSIKQSLNWNTILKTFVLTVGVRVCKYSSIVLLFTAIARAGFPELADADPGSIVVALLASEAGASLPIPTFMSFGTYEAGGLAAFAMLGLPIATAGLALFAIHLVTQAVDYTLGGAALLVFMMMTGLKPSMINELKDHPER